MRVLLAVHHFPPRFTGGAEWRAYRTAAGLQARGHEIQVISVESIDSDVDGRLHVQSEDFQGIRVHRLSYDLHASPDPFRWSYDNPWIAAHIRGKLIDLEADVFHLIGGYLLGGRALLVAKEENIPTVLSLTDYWFLCPRISMIRTDGSISGLPIDPVTCAQCLAGEKRRFRWLSALLPSLSHTYWHWRESRQGEVSRRSTFLLECLNQVDVILSPSNFLRSVHVDAGVPADRIRFMRQGLELPVRELNGEEESVPGALRLGYAGQIAPHKGVHVLLEALAHVPELGASLTIYGDFSKDPAYGRKIERMAANDPRVRLAGTFGREELPGVMRDLDVLVVPSLWYENSPNAILEAFAFGVPVVTSDFGGMAELVQDEINGRLFSVGDATDLAEKLTELARDPSGVEGLRSGIPAVKVIEEEIGELEGIYRRLKAESSLQLATRAR